MEIKLLADILMGIGSLIGLATKSYAVYNKDTKWPRKSSGTNVITYPLTALLPFFLLDLWFTLAVSFFKYGLRVAMYIWRAPDNEDWLGRKLDQS